ncbi:hypothetical protein KZX46_13635 [Polymorphobacter sp. PAMC 29334]|uniref:hypothetical protein n=1 Tax=Polymorphobacter sp. PAMC 29334 TaxID=2862331 RepID=UPI001C757EE4|nr:hypothetical protein [Polymorphobacter sp. PAMC 29334]QYE33864.1 hypothetical protein KZX46_13635 [Polymorphobacter sp. PAMC 29334]
MDIDKAVAHLDKSAGLASKGKCAAYVRRAIVAGGLSIDPHPLYAKDYGPYLLKAGLTAVAASGYKAAKGDVVVIQSYSTTDPAGHIAMYDGTQWVSDFKQHDIWAGPGYRIHRPALQVYRQ